MLCVTPVATDTVRQHLCTVWPNNNNNNNNLIYNMQIYQIHFEEVNM